MRLHELVDSRGETMKTRQFSPGKRSWGNPGVLFLLFLTLNSNVTFQVLPQIFGYS